MNARLGADPPARGDAFTAHPNPCLPSHLSVVHLHGGLDDPARVWRRANTPTCHQLTAVSKITTPETRKLETATASHSQCQRRRQARGETRNSLGCAPLSFFSPSWPRPPPSPPPPWVASSSAPPRAVRSPRRRRMRRPARPSTGQTLSCVDMAATSASATLTPSVILSGGAAYSKLFGRMAARRM